MYMGFSEGMDAILNRRKKAELLEQNMCWEVRFVVFLFFFHFYTQD